LSDTEPNDAVNAGMAIEIDGRRIVLYSKSPASDISLVGVRLHIGIKEQRIGSVGKER